MLSGVSASPGIAFGKALIYSRATLSLPSTRPGDLDTEVKRIDQAIESSTRELARLKERVRADAGVELAHIFRSQQTMIEDESIRSEMESTIRSERCSAEQALEKVFSGYVALFNELDDEDYNKERVDDLKDVRNRLLRNLLGVEEVDLSDLEPDTIIVATELFPSDTAMMDRSNVCGMITEKGGITSHVAILAKSMGVPAAVSVAGALETIATADEIILDSSDPLEATIWRNPDAGTRERLRTAQEHREQRTRLLAEERDREVVTPDGQKIILSANIGSPEDLTAAAELGVKSVGLFRTEFLFLKSAQLPTENEQYEAYRAAARHIAGGMVIIRTLDMGGDKNVPSFPLPKEANPFLGYRALRISLDHVDMFKCQLRAVLRASAEGDVRLMFPMISGLEEWMRARGLVSEVIDELAREGTKCNERLQVGIMVEVPSAVLLAEELAGVVDFMSIGTNDLTQYLLAADRLNEHVAGYYRPFHPAVFRAINQVVQAAHRKGKWVGVCGELAGMIPAIPVLLGLCVDELSMSPQLVPEARHVILRTPLSNARKLASQVLESTEVKAVELLMKTAIAKEEFT